MLLGHSARNVVDNWGALSYASESTAFGADYYTESYQAMAKTANNVVDVARGLESDFGAIFDLFGWLLTIVFAYIACVGILNLVKVLLTKNEESGNTRISPQIQQSSEITSTSETVQEPITIEAN